MIDIKNLMFEYPKSDTKAINRLNFNISKGEVFGFLGPNGAGKTTTQKIIIGLLKGYKGNVKIMGKERSSWNNSFFEKTGVAFEFPNLYQKLTAEENLKLIGSYYKKKICSTDYLLDKVGLLKDKDKKIEEFSKGMKIRVNFVRSIMHDPEVIFLDEPTSGLDPVNAKIIKEMILELGKKGKTVFLTTHNMTVAQQICNRVAFIVDGVISVIDNPNELMINHGKKIIKVDYIEDGENRSEEFSLENIAKNDRYFEVFRTKEIKTVHSQEATLEDVFIKLTGRNLT